MPSALETLVKILKLEQDTGYKNTAVIGGLRSYADRWAHDAHQQAKRPEHHQLIDEMVRCLHDYGNLQETDKRHEAVKYMMGRMMGRIPAPPDLPPSTYVPIEPPPAEPAAPTPPDLPPPPPPVQAEQVEPAPRVEPPSRPQPAPRPERRPERPPERPARSERPERARPPAPDYRTLDADSDDDSGVTFHALAPLASDMIDETENVPVVLPSTPVPRRARRENPSQQEIEQRLQELRAPITSISRIGDKMAEKLQKLGIETVEDMLYTFPRRYDDYTRMRTLNQVRPGEVVTVAASVRAVSKQVGRGGRPYLLVVLDDDTATLQVAFFGQLWLQRQFKRDSQVVLSGKVELFRGQLIMTNPEWEMLERENLHTRRIVPVYPLTKGLSARTMRRLMQQVVEQWRDRIPDFVPQSVLERANLANLGWALEQIHFPDSYEYLAHARTRLGFDELFVFQMSMLGTRRDWQSVPGQPLHASEDWLNAFLAALPYSLTAAQRRALDEIRADLAKDVPMNRLLQGDVGSGKTVVAAAAMALAVQQGKQAALMAPTSILAEQHARSVGQLLRQSPGGEGMQVRLLTGNTSEAERQEIYHGLAHGTVNVVIGTHALIQEGVNFHDLALVIVDEQHRFGVEQRGLLRGKGTNPHVLVMTATPIPRTLALTLYADLDLSIIDEMPPGRSPIETRVLRSVERDRAYTFIKHQLDQGRQAFVVYPLVESSDKLEDIGAAVDEYERLKRMVFPRNRVGLLHGRMRPAEKEAVMAAFAAGEIDVLVSTSVVEVGIDVPNASVILIENAERFGLAQLHQFRGRVGRGPHKSYCLLAAETPNEEADQRLNAMEDTTDGFKLAEIDWQMRGAGDLLGLRQSGLNQFRLAEVISPKLVELAQCEARTVYEEDRTLAQPEHQQLAQRVRALVARRADVS